MEKTKQQISIELREIQREISKARSMRNWAKITYLNQKKIKAPGRNGLYKIKGQVLLPGTEHGKISCFLGCENT